MIDEQLFPWLDDQWRAVLAAESRLSPALLFHGPIGVGKLAFARRLAQALLCESDAPEARRPCLHCGSCLLFHSGTHPDYLLIEPEAEKQEEGEQPAAAAVSKAGSAQISVAAVRTLIDFNHLSSSRGRRKVVVVHPAESMNHHAANGLLKTLEEPAPGLRLLLVSHRPGRLPATIRSRCSKVGFDRPDRATALQWLESQKISAASVALDEAAGAPLLARSQQSDAGYARADQVVDRMLQGDERPGIVEGMLEVEPERLLTLLQKRAIDRLAQALCRRAIYRSHRPMNSPPEAPERVSAVSLARWCQVLVAESRYARHPLNQRLFYERILNSVPSPADN